MIINTIPFSETHLDVYKRQGREVRLAERNAIRLVNERLLEAEQSGSAAALILCTGHFDIPEMRMPVFIPEKILFSLFRAMGVKRLGAIVPKPCLLYTSRCA